MSPKCHGCSVSTMTTSTQVTYTMTITMKRKDNAPISVPITDVEEMIIRLVTNGCAMNLIDMTTEIK